MRFEPGSSFSGGSFWETQAIDLRDTFDITFRVLLGCADGAADDGLVFAFQSIGASLGSYQQNMAFKGLNSNIGVELDLWTDASDGDPRGDHLAIIRDGDLNHMGAGTLAGPVAVKAGVADVQDCRWHELRIVWRDQKLAVYFDCDQRLQYEGDIIKDIFKGNSKVFWGLTSGSRSGRSEIQICSDRENLLDQLEDQTICAGSAVQLQAPLQGDFYVWSPAEGLSNPYIAAPLARPTRTSTYRLVVKEACGRQYVDELTITVADLGKSIYLGPPDTLLCEGTTLVLNAAAAGDDVRYRWSTGAETADIVVDQVGEYSVTVSTTQCRFLDKILVLPGDKPAIPFGTDTLVCEGEELLLQVGEELLSVQWEDGSREPTRRITQAGIYRVLMANACGEQDAEIEVKSQNCRDFYIPNAFSPNGDGVNDRFTVFGNGQNEQRIQSFRIFNRWGQLVYQAFDFLPGEERGAWNGAIKGRAAPQGTYLYLLETISPTGRKIKLAGEFQLLR